MATYPDTFLAATEALFAGTDPATIFPDEFRAGEVWMPAKTGGARHEVLGIRRHRGFPMAALLNLRTNTISYRLPRAVSGWMRVRAAAAPVPAPKPRIRLEAGQYVCRDGAATFPVSTQVLPAFK